MYPNLHENDLLITAKIKSIFDDGELTQEALAKGLGLTQPHVSRLLLGKTPWSNKYIEKFAHIYNIGINKILHDPALVPLVAKVCGEEGFDYKLLDSSEVLGMAPAPPGTESLEGIYCIEVEGDCFQPLLAKGNLIYARKSLSQEITDNSLVIFVDEKGRGCLKRVRISNDSIILKSLLPSGTDIVKPKSYLDRLDKVFWIKL